MNHQEHDSTNAYSEEWQPCPPGEFEKLSARLSAISGRRRFLQRSVAGAASVLIAGGAWWIINQSGSTDSPPATMACNDCIRLTTQFRGDLSRMAEPVREQIRYHLSHCAKCKKHLRAQGIEIS